MAKGHKRYFRAVLIIFIAAFCNMKLPHSSRSVIQYIIPPIKTSNGSRLYLSGVPIIIAILWGYKEIVKSNYFNMNKVLRAIFIFFIILPTIFKGVNTIKTPYYILNSGLKTIEIVNSKLVFGLDYEPNSEIKVELNLKNYSNEVKRFNISLSIPESLRTVISESTVMLPDTYTVAPHQNSIDIDETIEFKYIDGRSRADIIHSHYHFDNYEIYLLNEEDELAIVLNDSIS